MSDEALEKAAAHWSKPRNQGRTRWWSSPTILSHINRIVSGVESVGMCRGFHDRLAEFGPFKRAISVGCGAAIKESDLVKRGIVEHFDLFEISRARVEQGQTRAAAMGLAQRMSFRVENAFELELKGYDLVYWNNSLHHMLDTPRAVLWSRERLVSGGVFAMDDFVGPARFQWSDSQLEISARVRDLLPKAYVQGCAPVTRRTVAQMIAMDPTEAADSERIIPAVREVFPGVAVTPTGGVIYALPLNDVLASFAEDETDLPLLRSLLLTDHMLALAGENFHSVAIAKV